MNEAPEIVPPHPRTVAFWVARIFLAAVIVFAGWCAWRITRKTLGGGTDRLVEDTDTALARDPHDFAWIAKKKAEIAALDSQVAASKEALDRLDKRKKPTISFGNSDRDEFNRLNEETFALERQRAAVAAELDAVVKR